MAMPAEVVWDAFTFTETAEVSILRWDGTVDRGFVAAGLPMVLLQTTTKEDENNTLCVFWEYDFIDPNERVKFIRYAKPAECGSPVFS